ncbi:ParB/RepB/Spo0J family partition protein [Paraburkholderia terrae]|uniref:ParB/RepB/Spo0J family partition protein n=1 Tax=Paraburkholderia terrae TaxID=311230 RepID=UPI00296B06C9|nr:ParB/RepB/Spo0J family partition protein [Paraburkholderia terrae]MDW3655257.1 ParB/RepB/Spo0J family partition protein [Paraburkholderia terrae]
MSIKDRLAKKTGDLMVPAPSQEAGRSASPRTAPGQMLAFRSAMRESSDRVSQLEAQLKEYDGAVAIRALDPKTIQASKWANRQDFGDESFAELKSLIAEAGGNTQPIKVRPSSDGEGYEIVFGHRRHRACLELDLPVNAIVDGEITEQGQFVQMDQENRARKNLSPWEQGVWYKRALDDKLWPSQNAMAKACGLSQGNISSALLVAELPAEVVGAFPSPHDIQFQAARKLSVALKKAADEIVQRAVELVEDSSRTAPEVLTALLAAARPAAPVRKEEEVGIERKGELLVIRLRASGVPQDRIEELRQLITGFLEDVQSAAD